MLRYKLLLLACLVAAKPAVASESKSFSFADDGKHYDYKAELRGDVIQLHGAIRENGERFSLRVERTGWVAGEFGDVPVGYFVDRRARDELVAAIQDAGATAFAESAPAR
jgi:hypothetical protein